MTAAKPSRAARARTFLLEAKKACGCAATMATAAAAAGIIDGGTAAAIVAGAGVVTTGLVYWLENED